MRKKNRKHSKIDRLPVDLKSTVEQMLLAGSTYREIIEYLAGQGESISQSALCRHAQSFHANVEMVQIAQENFRVLMSEMERYPDLDTTEAIVRLASQNVLSAIAKTKEEDWQGVSVEKLIGEASGLVRAAAQKKRVDVQVQSVRDTALEEIKTLVFDAMRKEQPELYTQVAAFLNAQKGGAT